MSEAARIQTREGTKADIIITNGRIATMDKRNRFVSSVAIRDGYVVAVGDEGDVTDYRSTDTLVIDVQGRTVIPGLNDSHVHVIRAGLNYNLELRWDGLPSLADALQRLRDKPSGRRQMSGFALWEVGPNFSSLSVECRRARDLTVRN